MSAPQGAGEAEKNIEIWKVKKLIKRLEAARGNGTSMISLIIRKLVDAAQVVSAPLTLFYSSKGSDLESSEDVG